MTKLFGRKNKGTQIELAVRGMSCGHCEMRVQKALMGVPGVRDATASHEQGRAVVKADSGQNVSLDALVTAVQEAGYEAEPHTG